MPALQRRFIELKLERNVFYEWRVWVFKTAARALNDVRPNGHESIYVTHRSRLYGCAAKVLYVGSLPLLATAKAALLFTSSVMANPNLTQEQLFGDYTSP